MQLLSLIFVSLIQGTCWSNVQNYSEKKMHSGLFRMSIFTVFINNEKEIQ